MACRNADGRVATSLGHFATVDDLSIWRNGLERGVFVTIDVPIGLPESTRFRCCDVEARRRLGKRQSSVFMTPGRYLLTAQDYPETRRMVEERRRQEPETKGVGAQAWSIVPKIREVDVFPRSEPKCQEWLLEVHPEVCFLAWSDRLLYGKHSAVGQMERLGLTREEFPDAERAILEDLNATHKVDLTDILDAYAALWTALRRTNNDHETLVEVETLDGIQVGMIA